MKAKQQRDTTHAKITSYESSESTRFSFSKQTRNIVILVTPMHIGMHMNPIKRRHGNDNCRQVFRRLD